MDTRSMFPHESIADLAAGCLRRAIVSLPKWMAEPHEPLQERIVFFESPLPTGAGKYLEELLGKVWCLDTEGWADDGCIYGWVCELRNAHHQRPGCIAVDEDGRTWTSIGGSDQGGALMWLPNEKIVD